MHKFKNRIFVKGAREHIYDYYLQELEFNIVINVMDL